MYIIIRPPLAFITVRIRHGIADNVMQSHTHFHPDWHSFFTEIGNTVQFSFSTSQRLGLMGWVASSGVKTVPHVFWNTLLQLNACWILALLSWSNSDCWAKTWPSEATRDHHTASRGLFSSHSAALLTKCCRFEYQTRQAWLKFTFTSLCFTMHYFMHFLSHADTPSE